MDNEADVMRQQMDKTLAGLTDKLGKLERQVLGTVRTVNNSVNTVRNTFDLKLHVRQHPWTVLAGATTLGFLFGTHSSRNPAQKGKDTGPAPDHEVAAASPSPSASNGSNGTDTPHSIAEDKSSWLANLGETLQPEITELRGILIGALFGLVRDIVRKQVSSPVGTSPTGTQPRTDEQTPSTKQTSR